MDAHKRWLRRRLGRRRLWKIALVVCGLCVALFILYWHAGYIVSKEIGNSVQKELDTAWSNWKDLVQRLTTLEATSFKPISNVDCRSEPQSGLPFCNPTVDPRERASDLVARLSLEELVEQICGDGAAIPRLGVYAYNWRSECGHGWRKLGGDDWPGLTWTVFPAPIGLGATFNPRLLRRIGEATANEGRALHNLLLVAFNGDSVEGGGLNCFGPTANILWDPRWGRAHETYGEDPLVVSRLGVAYTLGLQGESQYLKVAASVKYYPVHSCAGEQTHHSLPHDLLDSFLPVLKSQILAGNVSQIYYAGNVDVDCPTEGAGVRYARDLLNTVLRQKFGARNISISSSSAESLKKRPELAAAVFINSTIDLDLGGGSVCSSGLHDALGRRLVGEQAVRDAVWRNLYLRIKLGDFDPPEMVPYQNFAEGHLNSAAYQTLNLQAARESIVLLKNLGSLLPMHVDSLNKLAVLGPLANSYSALLSGTGGNPAFVINILQGIREAVNRTHVEVEYESGCADVACSSTSLFEVATNIVHDADFVVMVMGFDGSEDGDRVAETECESVPGGSIGLPGCQQRLVEDVIDYHSRIILVLVNGGPLGIQRLFTSRGVVGVVEVFYPGALGGRAVSDVLFGRYNPGGKMPYTTWQDSAQIPNSKSLYRSPGRTYRYLTEEPLIPFGYGLSYSEFDFSSLDVPSSTIAPCEGLKLSVSVQNVGKVEGDEVIQVYIRPPRTPERPFSPSIQLVAFERVNIHPEVVHVAGFELSPYLLSLVDLNGECYVIPGQYTLVVTGGAEEKELSSTFSVEGHATNVVDCPHLPKCLVC